MATESSATDLTSSVTNSDHSVPAAPLSVSSGDNKLPSPTSSLPSVADSGRIRFGAGFRLKNQKPG